MTDPALPLLAGPPQEPEARTIAATLYVDADNQPALCANSLASLLKEDLGWRVTQVVVAGNNHGGELDKWRRELESGFPESEPTIIEVSLRKHAADLALVMEIGRNLDRHLRAGERLLIVSRDDLLIGAAEYAKSRGCAVIVAYVRSENVAVRSTQLGTLILPGLAGSPVPVESALPPMPSGVTAPQSLAETVGLVTSRIREMCPAEPGGGFSATAVGQALATLGFDTKAKRDQFLKSVPGLKEQGEGPNKRLTF